MKTRIIRNEDFARLVGHVGLDVLMDEMIDRLFRACLEFDPTRVQVRTRDGFHYQEPFVGLLEWMPVIQFGRHITVKMVGYHPSNPSNNRLPTILSTIGTYDTATGHLAGLADGTFLTALRTAASSVVASRVLARPDTRVLGLVGAGAQAVAHLHAMLRAFPIDRVLISDTDPSAMHSFAERVASFAPDGLDIRPAPMDLLLQSSDMLCTATTIPVGAGPLFEDTQTRPWLHVNAVGADFPGKHEMPLAMLRRGLVCPDFSAQAALEGECQQLAPDEIGPDLVGLIQSAQDFEVHRDGLTIFDSTGFALEDQVAMDMALEYAEDLGLGIDMQLEAGSLDPLNPYDFSAADDNAGLSGAGLRQRRPKG